VFGLLVGPPAAASLLARTVPRMMALAAVIAVVSVWLGLTLSYYLDTAASATMALIPVIVFFFALAWTRLRRSGSVAEPAR
jgi:ABC-type Mn2+/Zn2+ transport system permease subunit